MAFGGERSGVELDQSLGRRRLFEAVARLRCDVALLGSAAGGKARSLVRSIIAVARGVYIGVVASALLVGIGGNTLLSQIEAKHPAPLVVSTRSSPFIDFAEDSLSDYEVHGGRDARIFTSALIVQPDLDRSARRDRRVSRILYFSRGAGLADYRSRRTATYSAHARSNRRSPQR